MAAERDQPTPGSSVVGMAAAEHAVPEWTAFASVDIELFDVDAIPFGAGERRSVGEMLTDVDHQARLLLFDVDGDSAGALVRGWPALVSAACDLWTALPRTSFSAEADHRPMDRLAAHTTSFNGSIATGWPGTGDPDPRLVQMAETLRSADGLVRRYGPEIDVYTPAVRHDLLAAQARIVHALYVAAHAGNVALLAHGRDRLHDARQAGRKISLSTVHSPYAIAPTTSWVGRFATAETILAKLGTGRFAAGGAQAQPSPVDPHRIARALAGWDIQAHRTMATSISPANNVIVARTQALIASAALSLADAAEHGRANVAGIAGPNRDTGTNPVTGRLLGALDELARAWNDSGSRWDDLPSPADRADPHLVRASAELRASYRELTHDPIAAVPPADLAQHPFLPRALAATLAAVETGPELADVLAERATQPDLAGRARALSRRAHNDVEAGRARPDPSGDVVWVSPRDIHTRQQIPLPAPARQTLCDAASLATAASYSAAALAAQFLPHDGAHGSASRGAACPSPGVRPAPGKSQRVSDSANRRPQR